eukprot:8211313-Pyramimonas_sp.AAC.1
MDAAAKFRQRHLGLSRRLGGGLDGGSGGITSEGAPPLFRSLALSQPAAPSLAAPRFFNHEAIYVALTPLYQICQVRQRRLNFKLPYG